MNEKELRRSQIIQAAIEGLCTVREASARLGISERRVKQLKREVRAKGPEAVIHASKGKKRPTRITQELKERIIKLKKSDLYKDANFTHFRELLEEYEHISISYASLYRVLSSDGIKSNKRHRRKQSHPRRERRHAFGELLQADGTPFDWFSSGKRQSLHGFIDDATGVITGLYMCENECMMGYIEVLRQTIETFGIPSELYPDKAGIFFVNQKKLTIEEELAGVEKPVTKFGEIVEELDIDMHPAHSSQAKGRIERLWGTLQSRLFTEFKIHGIKSIEQANKFLKKYIKKYNKQFSVKAATDKNMFMPLPKYFDLDHLLSVKYSRRTDNGGTISFQGHKLQVVNGPATKEVTVLIDQKHGIRAYYEGKYYEVVACDETQERLHLPKVIEKIIYDELLKNGKAA